MTNLSVIRGTGTKTSKKVEALSVAKLRAILEDMSGCGVGAEGDFRGIRGAPSRAVARGGAGGLGGEPDDGRPYQCTVAVLGI